jgi:hypothetical protein
MYFGKEEEVCNVTTHYRNKTVPWQPLAGRTVYLTRDSLLDLHFTTVTAVTTDTTISQATYQKFSCFLLLVLISSLYGSFFYTS